MPAIIDLRTVDLDELDIAALQVDRRDHLRLDGDHAISVRDTDPLAQALFALLRNDCHADRLLVWQELASTLDGELNDAGRLALAAARICCDDLECEDPERDFHLLPLSEREYEGWWKADTDRQRSWPSVSSVRRWLGGSWPKVLDHLGQVPSPSSRGQRLGAQLGEFSPEELEAQLALCRSELSEDPNEPLDYVPWREYRSWAHVRALDDDLPLPRLCLQPHRFRVAFGSWPAAVKASGGCQTAEGRRAAARAAHPRDAYSPDACIEAVRYVGDRAGGSAMGGRDYDDEARALKADLNPPPDLPAVLPKSATIASKLGCWPQALHLAGFIDAAELDRRLARVTVALTDGQLLAVMANALRAIGANASHTRYRRYRAAMRAEHGPRVGLPSLETIYLRLGKWPEAAARVLAAFPDIATCTPTWTEEDE